ncbi:hypothetical protein DICA1_E30570 [Diutina catenulata]
MIVSAFRIAKTRVRRKPVPFRLSALTQLCTVAAPQHLPRAPLLIRTYALPTTRLYQQPTHIPFPTMPQCIHEINGQQWFVEQSDDAFPGQGFALQVKKILHEEHSEFQHILLFESLTYGNVLVLNGIVQCTERDEYAYQELICHVPMMAHPNPKRVLVIGGGDCGVVREVVKHPGVEVTMVEIDDRVIKLSQKYLPQMTVAIDNPRVHLVIDDGFAFLKRATQEYDVIITDSSDPEGPAQEFFEASYFDLLRGALAPGGVVIMQSSENIWLNLDYLQGLVTKARSAFDNVGYCQCYMPSYTGGQLGLLVASKDAELDLTKATRPLPQAEFKYYSPTVHQASFVLPQWAHEVINGKK